MSRLAKDRGVVLISILTVTAVIAAIAWQMMSRQALLVEGMGAAKFALQAREYLLGAEQYARQLLVQDWQDTESRSFDSEAESWAATNPPFPVPGGTINMRVEDLQSRFNLNAVATHPEHFQSILGFLKIPSGVASEWLDWTDEDLESGTPGAEDPELLLQVPPLRSANAPAVHKTELRIMPSMNDAHSYDELEPLVVALPSATLAININTVGSKLLQALGVEPSVAEFFTAGKREITHLEEVTAFEAGGADTLFVVTSSYFSLWAEVAIGGQRARIESWLYRNPNDGSVQLIARSLEGV